MLCDSQPWVGVVGGGWGRGWHLDSEVLCDSQPWVGFVEGGGGRSITLTVRCYVTLSQPWVGVVGGGGEL